MGREGRGEEGRETQREKRSPPKKEFAKREKKSVFPL
jgi:hypothetical protein